MSIARSHMRAALIAAALALAGCAGVPYPPSGPAGVAASEQAQVLALHFLGGATVARQPEGNLRDFGGISGIDRDEKTGVWYLLSDDRSEHAPARFYTAAIDISEAGIRSIQITGVVALRQADGSTFPSPRQGGDVPDPEALRIDRRSGDLFWSSEGDRRRGLHPFVRRASRNGSFIAELPLPKNLRTHTEAEIGARDNLSIEGLSFTPDASALWIAMEAPLYEDGPVASLESGALARFTRVDRQGRVLGQYAYPVDRIPVAPTGGRMRADNGVSEILATDDETLLVVERSGREVDEGTFQYAIRLYEASVDDATDISRTTSLIDTAFIPMRKRLVLDLFTAGIGDTDNIEGAAWGPRLPNGNATLLLVSDDNFHPRQANRFMAFEVQPQGARRVPPASAKEQSVNR